DLSSILACKFSIFNIVICLFAFRLSLLAV
ncbi:MAG: hypothetical protein ACI9K4_001824, partial [Polaribacter sp.]